MREAQLRPVQSEPVEDEQIDIQFARAKAPARFATSRPFDGLCPAEQLLRIESTRTDQDCIEKWRLCGVVERGRAVGRREAGLD